MGPELVSNIKMMDIFPQTKNAFKASYDNLKIQKQNTKIMKRVKAKTNKSLNPSILESMTMAVTLSDRLRRAGIRECEPDCKTGTLHQNRKNQTKKGQAEKSNQRNKKPRNLSNELYSPHFKDCHQNKTTREKMSSKTYANLSKTLRRKIRGSVKKTVFASLDFIKDCRKYKKKVSNPEKHSELKNEEKSECVFSNHKQNHDVNEELLQLHDTKTYSQIPFHPSVKTEKGALILNVLENKEAENSCATNDNLFLDQDTEKVNMKEELINDKVSGTVSYVKPFFDEFPSGDVAKIDKKYLQSLLSLTNAKDKTYTDSVESKNNEEAAGEKNSQKKVKKKSNEIPQRIKLNKKSGESKGSAKEMQNIEIPSNRFSVLAKTVRDSTKSEAQILVQKNKFCSQRNSEMKSEKNMAHTKPEVHDTRKKRKNRNTSLKNKNKNKDFPHSVLPNETPKVVDVKELWRRDIREKSENSLSSNSSCTVPKTDADLEQKNLGLESYKVLKKFVEEEVKKLSNESEKKNNLKETESVEYNSKAKEFKSVNLNDLKEVENICKKLRNSMAENLSDEADIIENKISSLKKKLMQDEHPQRYSIYEGERMNPMLLTKFAEDKFKDQKRNKKQLKEIGKSSEKMQSKISNWSILNRLEQAFLALGTPNFQDKNIKNPISLKGTELINHKKTNANVNGKDQNHLEKINKKLQKSKEVEEKKSERDGSNSRHSTPRTKIRNKRPENDEKKDLIINNQLGNKFRKESENDAQQNNTLAKIAKDKKIDEMQEKKKITIQTTPEKLKKKPTVITPTKPKENDRELKESERKQDQYSFFVDNEQAQKNDSCQKTNPAQEKESAGENLVKKKTFDIIRKKDPIFEFSGSPKKSENCDKTRDFEMKHLNAFHSQTKNMELKKDCFFHKNTTDISQSKGENITNETETVIKSFIPIKSIKTPIKINPKTQEEHKSAEEKENLEIFRKSLEAKENLEMSRKSLGAKENLEMSRKSAVAKKNIEVSRKNADAKDNLETLRKIAEAKKNLEMFRKSARAKENSEMYRKSAEAKENLQKSRKCAEEKDNLETLRKIAEAKKNLEMFRKSAEAKNNSQISRSVEATENFEISQKSAEAKEKLEVFQKKAQEKHHLGISQKSAESMENIDVFRKKEKAKGNLKVSQKGVEDKNNFETSQKTEQETSSENQKETGKFPTRTQEKKLPNNSSERVIKERSILSISKSQQGPKESIGKLKQIETSEIFSALQLSSSDNSETEKSQNDLSDFLESSAEPLRQINGSTISSLDISNFELPDSNSAENPKERNTSSQENNPLILSKKLYLSSDFSNNNLTTVKQDSSIEMKETKPNVARCQTKKLWEQDIHHYHAVVKEIMNHYNRIKGFLTHSDHFQSFSNDSAELLSMKSSTEQDSVSNKSLKMNLREYRKKIMSEYQAIPIFEYKKLLKEKKEENLLTKEATKRNLTVVKDITAELDLDVKDYEPQIQKVLDSQLYVDVKNLCKRNHLNFKEKKSSLQEIELNKKKKMDNQEHLRTSSTLKTLPPLNSSSVSVESSRKLKTKESFQEDSTETVTSTSMEETESENPERISQSRL